MPTIIILLVDNLVSHQLAMFVGGFTVAAAVSWWVAARHVQLEARRAVAVDALGGGRTADVLRVVRDLATFAALRLTAAVGLVVAVNVLPMPVALGDDARLLIWSLCALTVDLVSLATSASGPLMNVHLVDLESEYKKGRP